MSQNSERFQSLSTKVLAVVSVAFLVLFVGQYGLARLIISRSFSELEQEQVATNAERLSQIVSQEIEGLNSLTQDWGWWIDTYEYVQGGEATYVEDNLQAPSFETIALDFIVMYNVENQPVYAGLLDAEAQEVVELPPEIINDIAAYTSQLSSDDLTSGYGGLLMLGQQPTFLSINNVLKSDNSGPRQGAIVMGRFVDETVLAAFSEATQLPVEAFSYVANGLPLDVQTAQTQLAESQEKATAQVLSEDDIAGYSLISDLEEQPVLLLKATMGRDIYAQGQTTLKYYLWSTALIGIAFSGLILLLLRKLVLSRLESLNKQVNEIGRTTQTDSHIELSGEDELSSLASTINQTMEQLHQRTNELSVAKQSAEEAKETAEEAKKTAEEAKAVADKANHAKSSFLANMSHELRTPLNAILGFTQVLGRERTLTGYQREKLSIINRSGEHLLSLINDVLDMSKIESGRIELNSSSFDLHYMLETLEDMLQLKAKAQGIALIVERDEELPRYVYSDERKLRQILLNLLSNALKFTKEGSVTLSASCVVASAQAIKQPSDLKTKRMLFSVIDTGAGISAEEITQVFQPFVQTDSGRKSQEGTGLGLPISRKFVELMGGTMSATSELGAGSTFSFDISAELTDATDVQAVTPQRQVIGLAPGQQPYRILVVDDRALNRQLVRELLVPVGFEVQEAENGQQGVDRWQEWEPHLIWMDMQMPVLNGYEATRQIKTSVKGQATTIIALTASTLEEEKAVVLDAGCNDFMRKPFQQEELFAKMAEHLGLQYVYEDVAPTEQKAVDIVVDSAAISAAMLAMPPAWNEQLHQAAATLKEKEIFALLAKVPEDYSYLQQVIADKVSNFDFDQIEALAKQALKQPAPV